MSSSFAAAAGDSHLLSLPSLQSRMKQDPDGYTAELALLRRRFESSIQLFSSNSTSGSGGEISKELGDLAYFLAHVAECYPEELSGVAGKLITLLSENARALPRGLRLRLAQSLILLNNRKIVSLEDTIELFMDLQQIGDRQLRKLASSHIVHSIRRANKKHKNDKWNRALKRILFKLLEAEEDSRAIRALSVICDLHRRRVWFDDSGVTANAICDACLHSSSRVMVAALRFLHSSEQAEEEDESEASSDDDDDTIHVSLERDTLLKAQKGTSASKKKKKAKLKRIVHNMKKMHKKASQENSSKDYTPLIHLKDPQGFAEKFFSRLQRCNEPFKVRMMMLTLTARTVRLHRLILLNLYPYLTRYASPHQEDVTTVLAAVVEACHDMVPPDAVEGLFRHIVQNYIHERSRSEVIAVGLNTVKEICIRMPLLMTEELLQDLVLYKKSNDKNIARSARELLKCFREICPSLLAKKDRGRSADLKARPKAYGEVNVPDNVPGMELLQDDDMSGSSDDEFNSSDSDEDGEQNLRTIDGASDGSNVDSVEKLSADYNNHAELEDPEEEVASDEEDGESSSSEDDSADSGQSESDVDSELETDDEMDDEDDLEDAEEHIDNTSQQSSPPESSQKRHKRKMDDFLEKVNSAEVSLRALKKLATAQKQEVSGDGCDGILSNEDFQRIKELKAKKEANEAMAQHGLKIQSSERLSMKRVNSETLKANIRKKLTKQQRDELHKAHKEERGKYRAKSAIRKKKTGGLSNKQKEHKKGMPIAAKRAKIARSRQEKKRQQRRSGKQFRGKKAWK